MSEPKKAAIRPFAINRTIPSQNQVILVENYAAGAATTRVRLETSDGTVNHAFAIITEPDVISTAPLDLPQGDVPNGFTRLDDQTNGVFSTAAVPISSLPNNTPPAFVNKKVTFAAYIGTALTESKSILFVAMPPTTTSAVNAKACLWLTYARTGFTGPFGETLAATAYVPLSIAVPESATKATVTATDVMWRHDPDQGTQSNAAGRSANGTNVPLNPSYADLYKNAMTNNHAISSGSFPLNRLVALWEYDDLSIPTTVRDVGVASELPVILGPAPANMRPARLRLGFHDGFEWSNNQGQMPVTITWATT